MIGKLKGIIDTKNTDSVIIDVAGVGYIVFCASSTIAKLPNTGEAATIYIETHVREDHIHLYGFSSTEQKDTFLLLNKVNGVGAKMALSILSILSPAQLSAAIASRDKAAFKSVSGVGPKLAERLITELKDKFSGFVPEISDNQSTASNVAFAATGNINDAISALVNLGYGRSDVYTVVNNIAAINDNAQLDLLIREGLKELGRS